MIRLSLSLVVGLIPLLAAVGCAPTEEEAPLVPPATPGAAEDLAGTTWEVEGYVLAFEDPPDVHISGEAVPFPGGVDGEFSVENGIIRVGALGRYERGTWDGTVLVFEGMEAVKTAGETGDDGSDTEQPGEEVPGHGPAADGIEDGGVAADAPAEEEGGGVGS